jgi:hypothetical protein
MDNANAPLAASTAAETSPVDPPSRIPWVRIALWFAATRVAVWTIAGLALRFVPHGRFWGGDPRGPLDWLMHWDSQWFLTVAGGGYEFDPTRMSNVNFLPMYPLMIRAVQLVFGNIDLSAYIASYVCCFIASGLLWRLARDVTGRNRTADYAVLFFLLGPVAVFFASIYSEATFMVFAVATFLAMRRRWWFVAGLCGAGAALSRSVGLFLVIPLAIEFVLAHREVKAWRSLRTWLGFACCGLPAAGTAAYFAYLGWKFGNWHAYFISQQYGGHFAAVPWKMFSQGAFTNLLPFYKWWFGATVFVGIGLTIATAALRLPWSHIGFSFALCALYISIESLEGIPRFFSIVVPLYLVMGIVTTRWPAVGKSLLALSALLLALSVTLFTNGYWFT